MKVYAVTVTYGNRYQFVEKLVERLILLNIDRIVIIDNASAPESQELLKSLAEKYSSKIFLITNAQNRGSAGGFKDGLMFAELQSDCEFIWLLDDDNLPDYKALNELTDTYRKLNIMCCLLSLRKSRVYRKINNDIDVKRKFRCNNSFIDYSLRNWFRKKILYSLKGEKQLMISIPYAPYGGMFFPKELLKFIGYPNEQMYLFMDDHEFSRRIVVAGMKIYLVRSSTVEDIETSWHVQKKYFIFHRFQTLIGGDPLKTYYLFRNSMYLEQKYFVTNKFEYALNKSIYKSIFYTLCFLLSKSDRIAIFRKASSDSKKIK